MQWAQAYLLSHPISPLYDQFIEKFKLVFDQPSTEDEATCCLLSLKQRNHATT